ncbi:MAG: hypothetical protein WCI73_06140 [Phycisphaerae bacterium]
MLRKALVMAVVAASLLVGSMSSRGTNTDTPDIDLTATVDAYFVWDAGNTYIIGAADWDDGSGGHHVVGTSTVLTAGLTIAAGTNTSSTITLIPTGVPADNNGVLTNGAQTLTTSYKLNDAGGGYLTKGGGATNLNTYVQADGTNNGGIFAGGGVLTYTLAPNASGNATFLLGVKAVVPAGTNPAAGNYTAKIRIRATW